MEKNMSINLILARDANNGIGQNNGLPWPHNKLDMKWFKDNTLDDVVLMGRKTWESIGSKPLPYRYNYIISSRNYGSHVAGYQKSFSEAIENLTAEYPYNDIWIIGGASIYEQAVDVADNLYLTTFTCPVCAKLVSETGIKAVYFADGYSMVEGLRVLEEAGVEVVKVTS